MNAILRQMQEETKARRARMGMVTTPVPIVRVLTQPKAIQQDNRAVRQLVTASQALAHRRREELRELREDQARQHLEQGRKIRGICHSVCAEFDLSITDLLSSRRLHGIVVARHVACYLAKTLTGMSLPEIGRRMGGRDHTTILHAIAATERRLAADEVLRARVARLIRRIQTPLVNPDCFWGS